MRSRLGTIIGIFIALACAGWIHGTAFTGIQYFMSPTGNDGNNGLSAGSPWLTPNHSVNCGDVINAAAGTYASSSFNKTFGTVSNCPSPNGVYYTANILCAGPFVSSCQINDTSLAGMFFTKANWSISGWTITSTVGPCTITQPQSASNIHHIAIINSVITNCLGGGIGVSPYPASPGFGVDQFAAVGDIIYNATSGTAECFGNFSDYEPILNDSTPGTHIFVAGVFSWGAAPGVGCASGLNSDWEGMILDDLSHSQQSPTIAYTGQIAIEQSMFLGNGGQGVQILNNTAATVIGKNVTSYGNFQAASLNTFGNAVGGLEYANSPGSTTFTNSIFQETKSGVGTSCAGSTPCNVYAALVSGGGSSNVIDTSYAFGVGGQNTLSVVSPGFSFGAGIVTATPNFVNPTVPGAPSCAGFTTTTACMATVIADFTAQAAGAAGLGYQSPGACAPDALFPVWLKGIVPNGIITKPCGM